jgi:hypothetical protein
MNFGRVTLCQSSWKIDVWGERRTRSLGNHREAYHGAAVLDHSIRVGKCWRAHGSLTAPRCRSEAPALQCRVGRTSSQLQRAEGRFNNAVYRKMIISPGRDLEQQSHRVPSDHERVNQPRLVLCPRATAYLSVPCSAKPEPTRTALYMSKICLIYPKTSVRIPMRSSACVQEISLPFPQKPIQSNSPGLALFSRLIAYSPGCTNIKSNVRWIEWYPPMQRRLVPHSDYGFGRILKFHLKFIHRMLRYE